MVLAIDDDPNVVYLLQENLAEAGYRVVGAASGVEGVQQARELRPFAITLDILMPHKDGWQVLYELKADAATRDIPIIVLSIVDQKDLGYRLGAFDYLLKPFERDTILAILARIAPSRGRLLVVDDDPQVGDLVRQLLEDESYEIEAVVDGQEALQAVTRQRPDVMLLDLLMPHLDGFSVLEYLQQDPRYRDMPVIVLTAKMLTVEEKTLLQQRVRHGDPEAGTGTRRPHPGGTICAPSVPAPGTKRVNADRESQPCHNAWLVALSSCSSSSHGATRAWANRLQHHAANCG